MRPSSPERDRETVRRGLVAGAAVAALAFALLEASSVARRGFSAEAAALVLAIALILGALVAAAWLVLAAVLDLFAGEAPGLRRWVWAGALLLLAAVVMPLSASLLAG